jgi:hypothetical protein
MPRSITISLKNGLHGSSPTLVGTMHTRFALSRKSSFTSPLRLAFSEYAAGKVRFEIRQLSHNPHVDSRCPDRVFFRSSVESDTWSLGRVGIRSLECVVENSVAQTLEDAERCSAHVLSLLESVPNGLELHVQ